MIRFGDHGEILHYLVWTVEESLAERIPEMGLTHFVKPVRPIQSFFKGGYHSKEIIPYLPEGDKQYL
jgi:hypothetical protein